MLWGHFLYAPSENPDISDGLYCDVPNIFAVQEAAGTDNEHRGAVVGCEDKQPIKGLSCLGLRYYFKIRVPKFSEERPLFSTLTMIMAEVVAKLTTFNMTGSSDPDETMQPVVTRFGLYCMPIIHSTVINVNAFCTIILTLFLMSNLIYATWNAMVVMSSASYAEKLLTNERIHTFGISEHCLNSSN